MKQSANAEAFGRGQPAADRSRFAGATEAREWPDTTRWSHSRSAETIDRPRPRASGSNRPTITGLRVI